MAYIEKDFPIEKLNPIAQKEAPVGGRKPIYNLHKWWARRLGSVFRMLTLSTFSEDLSESELWERYYSKNQLKNTDGEPPIILDPFMGGGTTVVEALRLGCKVVGVDLNPVSWFVTKKEIEPVDLDEFDKTVKQLERSVRSKIQRYYQTMCPKGHKADSMYIFWVNKISCLTCGRGVPLFSSFRIASNNGRHTVFCPECYLTFEVENYKVEATCPECSKRFVPADGYSGHGKYTCPYCGQKDDILATIKRQDTPPALQMFALEYYCRVCGRGYKRTNDWDLELFDQARQEFKRRKEELLFPRQAVPDGLKTRELLNYGYKYFHQIFNERQLLCLSMLLEAIKQISDESVRELFLLAISSSADYNNMFCKYNASYRNMQNLFAHHAYWPTMMPTENNVWGAEYGKGTFKQACQKIRQAKRYCISPFEKSVDADGNTSKHFTRDPVEAHMVHTFDSLKEGKGNAFLVAQTAEDLSFLPDEVIDAIITDPPYCDNVMYSELADFFHVWLRLVLADTYDSFEPEYSPRTREIVKNAVRHGGNSAAEEFFFRGLTRSFKEANRVLANDGLMVFTFHHKEPWAWKGVLASLLEAGFYIISVYPISSESPDRTHAGISYDIPFVCRKRLAESRPVAWEDLKDEIYFKAQESVERVKAAGRSIADVDLFVIVMGRCLELYSKHWPKVMKDEGPVEVDEAIDDIEAIVDSLIKSYELKQLPVVLDEPTRLYLLYIAGRKSLTHDELNKRIQTGGGSMTEIMQRGYVTRRDKVLGVTKPRERLPFIEREIERKRSLHLIDVAHYLYAIYEEGRPLQRYLSKWGREELIPVMAFLHRKSGDKVYGKIAEQMSGVIGGGRKQETLNLET